ISGINVQAYRYSDGVKQPAGIPAISAADGSYSIAGLSTGAHKLYFRDPSNFYAYRYYVDSKTIDLSSDVHVIISEDTPNIDMVLPLAAPPAVTVPPLDNAQVTSDPSTG